MGKRGRWIVSGFLLGVLLSLYAGHLVQLLAQQREFIRQSVSTRLFLQGFDTQPMR